LSDPALAGRFHPDEPDDILVDFFHGSIGERMWVKTTGVDGELRGYTGKLLNQPHQIPVLQPMTVVSFRVASGAINPIWISPTIRANLAGWAGECKSCGFDLLVEPAREVIARQFGGSGVQIELFTTRCRMCNGSMLLERRVR
jgi:hypothetical protein